MWAALELFSTYGYEKISMSDIAVKGQFSKVSIYEYFGSKNNLRKLLAINIMDDSLERLNVLIKTLFLNGLIKQGEKAEIETDNPKS